MGCSPLQVLFSLLVQPSFSFDSGLGTTACSHNGLLVVWVAYIACGKYTGYTCSLGSSGHLNIALCIELKAVLEEGRVWGMANGEEEAIDGQIVLFFIGFALAMYLVGTLYTVVAIES